MTMLTKLTAAFLLAVNVGSVSLITETGTEKAFLDFSARHGKNYDTLAEFNKRMLLWKATDDFIRNYPEDTFTMAHNKFSDWTPEEKKKHLGFKHANPNPVPAPRSHSQ
jgi:Cathepsin propeptide inhibitor domain (I29)